MGKGIRNVGVGHRPDPAIPGTVSTFAFPTGFGIEIGIVGAGSRHGEGSSEGLGIGEMFAQSGEMLLGRNVAEKGIEPNGGFIWGAFSSTRMDVHKQACLFIPHPSS